MVFPPNVSEQDGCEQEVAESVHHLRGRVLYHTDEEMPRMWRAHSTFNGIAGQVSDWIGPSPQKGAGVEP